MLSAGRLCEQPPGHGQSAGPGRAERGTWLVVWITALTMVLEIAAGVGFNSMALLADGWHMGSHVAAIGLSAVAYATARRFAHDPRFAFGTWKIEILGGFASAVFLLVVAALMAAGSLERLITPRPIDYAPALGVAALGLVVNLVCAFILGRSGLHGHPHGPHPVHPPARATAGTAAGEGAPAADGARVSAAGVKVPADGAQAPDLNLRSAYLHVLADALTSVLALLALLGGWMRGWSWLDPVMGLVGAVLVALWARGLIAETARVLLDREMDHPLVERLRQSVEQRDPSAQTRIVDLHVWRVGPREYFCALTLETRDAGLRPCEVRRRLAAHPQITHATIEIRHPGPGGARSAWPPREGAGARGSRPHA